MSDSVPQIVEYSNQRILTTKQIAEVFGTDVQVLTNNFNRNKDHYTVGKHYYALEGDEKRAFLNLYQNDLGSKNAKVLYLWTEKGALQHAKSLGTDEAWAMHERLVDGYFRLKAEVEERTSQPPPVEKGPNREISDRLWITSERLESRILDGYWAIITELHREVRLAEVMGKLDGGAFPEKSVGRMWAKYARLTLKMNVDALPKYMHYDPAAKRPKEFPALMYPLALLPTFRRWFSELYLPFHCKIYIDNRRIREERRQRMLAARAARLNLR